MTNLAFKNGCTLNRKRNGIIVPVIFYLGGVCLQRAWTVLTTLNKPRRLKKKPRSPFGVALQCR
uniref:Uncharacterized protein n=1 Tax=Anguilla anguilla TaxID=7936 RepID=A0A0E9Q642_ANGAN